MRGEIQKSEFRSQAVGNRIGRGIGTMTRTTVSILGEIQ